MNLRYGLISFIVIFILSVCYAETYHVGPGMDYQNIGDVPLDSISAGDSVKIEYREEPYREKWVISAAGTEENPVFFTGVASPDSGLPVIDGDGAITSEKLDFWSETRGIIKIGGSSTPRDSASWIIVENLDIRNARPGFYFTDDAGAIQEFSSNASAVYVEKGSNITFRNCIFHSCGNGFFASYQSSSILVEGCYYYDNGIEGSIYEHNNYTECNGITFQFNRFGHLREGCPGNNLKDRSAGTVIRYNWIQGGNRQLDLVDAGHTEINGRDSYWETYVYGNILIEDENTGNSQICHYGGDSGDETNYRKGILWFYYNSVISFRDGRMTLLRLSSEGESANVINNVIYSSSGGENTAVLDGTGSVYMLNNWIGEGWKESHSAGSFDITNEAAVIGTEPGFSSGYEFDFSPEEGSVLIDNAAELPSVLPTEHIPDRQYFKHCEYTERDIEADPDIGAFSNSVSGVRTDKYLPVFSPGNFKYKLKNGFLKIRLTSNIKSPGIIFIISDLNGRKIAVKHINNSATAGEFKTEFNFSGFSQGLYLIEAAAERQRYSGKVILIK